MSAQKIDFEKEITLKLSAKHVAMIRCIFAQTNECLKTFCDKQFYDQERVLVLNQIEQGEDYALLDKVAIQFEQQAGDIYNFICEYNNENTSLVIGGNKVINGDNYLHIGCQSFTKLEIKELYRKYFGDPDIESIEYKGVKVTREIADRLLKMCEK